MSARRQRVVTVDFSCTWLVSGYTLALRTRPSARVPGSSCEKRALLPIAVPRSRRCESYLEPRRFRSFPADIVGVNQVAARLRGRLKPKRINADLAEMQEALNQGEAPRYECGLTALGSFLGAEASKPKGQGRCDSAWVRRS